MKRPHLTAALFFCLSLVPLCIALPAAGQIQRFARFRAAGAEHYGIVEGEIADQARLRRIEGNVFGRWRKTDDTFALQDVQLLVPTRPTQVLALAGNYESHLGDQNTTQTTVTTVTSIITDADTGESRADSTTSVETRKSGEVPEKFRIPQPFFKSPSCLIPQAGTIVLPRDAGPVHYEAELVVVIGRTARNVSKQEAMDCVFGVTCGNDVSARVWQKGDVQWWRAKGSDTFGPCGPFIARGLDYDNLQVTLRINGEVRQHENTRQLIHDIASTVSFLSRHVTLHPGDLIFTGTPGETDELHPGDQVEVEIEGVGILRNQVAAERP